MFRNNDVFGFFAYQSTIYNAFRPKYPDELVKYIVKYVKDSKNLDFESAGRIRGAALDVARGTG